jgi:hypothetical protein
LGSLKIDIHKEEYEWRNVNEATLESIKGLLKYRYKFDPLKNIDEAIIVDDGDLEEYRINYEAIHNYIDLDRHIQKAKLGELQKKVLQLYQSGLTEKDIAEEIDRKQQSVNRIIKTICKKIYFEALEEWKSYIHLDVIKTPYNYKQCIKCQEYKPLSTIYFRQRNDNYGDGFRPECRKCESSAKKVC